MGTDRLQRASSLLWAVSPLLLCLVGCGGAPKTDPRYPPRPAGCEVSVVHGPLTPPSAYERLGRVDAICGNDIGEAACMRTLMDQACKLGGDTIFDLPAQPTRPSPDKVKWEARVAHTRATPSSP